MTNQVEVNEIVEDQEIVQDIVEEQQETNEVEAIPFDTMIVRLFETPLLYLLPDEESKRQFTTQYEMQTLPLLELIKFNEVLTRKVCKGELTDNQVIAFGFGIIGVSALINIIPFWKKIKEARTRKKETQQTNAEQIEEEVIE